MAAPSCLPAQNMGRNVQPAMELSIRHQRKTIVSRGACDMHVTVCTPMDHGWKKGFGQQRLFDECGPSVCRP